MCSKVASEASVWQLSGCWVLEKKYWPIWEDEGGIQNLIWAVKLSLSEQAESSWTDDRRNLASVPPMQKSGLICMVSWMARWLPPVRPACLCWGVFLHPYTHGRGTSPPGRATEGPRNYNALTLDELFAHLTGHRPHHGLRLQVTLEEEKSRFLTLGHKPSHMAGLPGGDLTWSTIPTVALRLRATGRSDHCGACRGQCMQVDIPGASLNLLLKVRGSLY